MKLKLLVVLNFLIMKLDAIDISELEKNRAALIATLQLFPHKYLPVSRFLRASSEEVTLQINSLYEQTLLKDFFEIYRCQIGNDTALLLDSVRGLPLHIRYMQQAREKFDALSDEHAAATSVSKLFQTFKVRRNSI